MPKTLMLLWLISTVSGCSTIGTDPNDPNAVSEQTRLDRDDFRGINYFEGPLVSNEFDSPNAEGPEIEEYRLSAESDPHQKTRFTLEILDYYEGDWRGFDQAYDNEGHRFHALAVRHKVDCKLLCGFEEVLEINLPREYLDNHKHSGITVKLYGPGRASSQPLHIPGSYIQGFMAGAYTTDKSGTH